VSIYIYHEGYQLRQDQIENTKNGNILNGILYYVWSFDNILDTCLIICALHYQSLVGYNSFILSLLNAQMIRFNKNTEFFNFYHSFEVEKYFQLLCNLMIFLAFLKALNLLKFNPKTYLITDTLRKGFADLSVLIIFLLSNLIIFGLTGHILFYTDPQFYTTKLSINTSILAIVRNVDFFNLIYQQKKLLPLFLWQTLMWFYVQRVIICFLISVIIAKFNEVRSNHQITATEKTFNRIIQSSIDYFRIYKIRT
jgi:hypothetical protein